MNSTTSASPQIPVLSAGSDELSAFSPQQKEAWLLDIKFLPQAIEYAIINLDETQLQTPYREGGWTVHQVVHHVADSHMNAYIRFKLALTEDTPTIKPYLEARWAELPDSKAPIKLSLPIVEGVHKRWVILLRSMKPEDFEKKLFHPEHNKELFLKTIIPSRKATKHYLIDKR